MCEAPLTEPTFRVESLNDIFRRIRPTIKSLLPFFDRIHSSSIICINTGQHSIGKSMIIMEIIANILLKKEKIEVLLIDPERNFKIFDFIGICLKVMLENQDESQDKSMSRAEEQIENQLERLHIMYTYESNYMSVTAKLEQNPNISLVIVDSLDSQFYSAAYEMLEAGRSLSKDYFIAQHLYKLKTLVKTFEVTVVCTRLESKSDEGFQDNVSHVATLKKEKDLFLMKIRTVTDEKEIVFSIDTNGVKILTMPLPGPSKTLNIKSEV